MKIELWYDAVAQETDIRVNDIAIEKNDVFGFLYPVRNYPLQSWIYPNGSWKGIEYQIEELARGEEVALTFHGRKWDYEDLHQCLSQNKRISMNFVEWDVCSRYDSLFSELLRVLKQKDEGIREQIKNTLFESIVSADFEVSDDNTDWIYTIAGDFDLSEAREAKGIHCYYVRSSFFTSYEKLHDLVLLTRSLKVPADAIYCCFADPETKNAYAYYAGAHKRMRFSFCLEDNDDYQKASMKYDQPQIVKAQIRKCRELLGTLSDPYQKAKESTQMEFNELNKNIVNLERQARNRYDRIKQLRDNIDWFVMGMNKIAGYIDTLLSVSKENKEDVFHYECIDELEKKIKIYLNTTLCGVM